MRLVSVVKKVHESIFIFFLIWVTYVTKSLFKPYPLAGDEPNYLFNSVVLSKFQTVQSKPYYYMPELVGTIYPGGVLSPHVIGEGNVSYHGIGLSVFLLPTTFFENPVLASRIIMSAVVALLFAILHYLLSKFSSKHDSKWVLHSSILVVALGAPVIFNSDLLYPEFIGSILILFVVVSAYQIISKGTWISASALGFSLFVLPWFHVRFIPIVTFVLLIIYYESLRRTGRSETVKKFFIPSFAYLSSLILLSLAYKSWHGTYDIFFQRNYQVSGLKTLDFAGIYRTMGSYLFSGSEGLIPWQPILIFSLFGFHVMLKLFKRETIYFSASLLVYFFTITQAAALGGDTPPLHYMAMLVPFLSIPLYFFLRTLVSASSKNFVLKNSKKNRVPTDPLKTSRMSISLIMVSLTLWSCLLALAGSLDRGSTFIRSGIQGYPITLLATSTNAIWPPFNGPNVNQNYSLLPNVFQWAESGPSQWTFAASQGFRPVDTYENSVTLANKSEIEAVVSFQIFSFDRQFFSDSRGSNRKLCSKDILIKPVSEITVTIPCNIHDFSEVSWLLMSNSPNVEVKSSSFTPVLPLKPSSYSDLGFFLLAIFTIWLVGRNFSKKYM